MPGIGETLREARVRQAIDVSQVEDQTKIRAKYLRALENEEFDLLPGTTFARSFLRTYALYLGLDADVLLEEYRVRYEPYEPEEPEFQPFAGTRAEGRERRVGSPPGRGTAVLAVLGGLLLFLLVLGLVGGQDGSEPEEEPSSAGRRPAPAPPVRPRPPRPQTVTLEVRPAEETYVCIDGADGKRLFEGLLLEPRTFRDRRLRVNLGRASAAMRVNGRPVPVEDAGTPVGFAFTPDGREELPPAERPCA